MNLNLDKLQIEFIQQLKHGLDYHFNNYQSAELIASSRIEGKTEEEAREHFKALKAIKFEAQAYICQAGRLYHFLVSVQSKRRLAQPQDPLLKEVWDSVYPGGIIYLLRNKWAGHRSYDDPKPSDTELLHTEVMLNLDQFISDWINGHNKIHIKGQELDLCEYHPKMLNFLDWLYVQLK